MIYLSMSSGKVTGYGVIRIADGEYFILDIVGTKKRAEELAKSYGRKISGTFKVAKTIY